MLVVARRLSFFLLLFVLHLGAATRPKLVVVLVIDQFRADYLEKFRADFVPGGFNRLLRQGAVFVNTNYNYSGTETAPGHATISTGAVPAAHGIVGNYWYDRKQKKLVPSIEDVAYKIVGVEAKGPGASPRNLIGTTLGDEMRLALGGQAVAVSLKDRAAILPGGKNPTAVFWLDNVNTGRAVTSTYYMDQLPAWVEEFNQKYALGLYTGKEWKALNAKPTDAPLSVIGKPSATSATGPASSPFGNDAVIELARRVVKEYKLGQGRTTDFLSVSLSSNDFVGHYYGPDSPQVADITRRTDRILADFFVYLDKSVGPGDWTMAFTAHHGAGPNPEVLKKQRFDAGRIQGNEVTDPIEAALRNAYESTAEEKWVAAQDLPDLYLDHDVAAKYRVSLEDAARRACQAARAVRGVYDCYTPGQLATNPSGGALGRAANSYRPGRSGDLLVIFSPFWIRDFPNLAANHGTPWSYDTHVPLIFMGPGFKSGVFQTPSTPADLAVTLAALLGINPPAVATGRVLDVALAPPRSDKPTTGH